MAPYSFKDITTPSPKYAFVSLYENSLYNTNRKEKEKLKLHNESKLNSLLGQGENAVFKTPRSVSNFYKEKAKQQNKLKEIFAMRGNYPTIRRELVLRGYVEKIPSGQYYFLENLSEDSLVQHARNGNDYERVLMSRYLKSSPAYFVWHSPSDIVEACKPYRNIVRHRGEYDFTSKAGLIACASQAHWNSSLGHLHCPRFFNLCKCYDDRKAFIDDYRLTQCQSILRYACDGFNKNYAAVYDPEKGTIPLYILSFAYHKVKNALTETGGLDLEPEMCSSTLQSKLETDDWKSFLTSSQLVLNQKAMLKANHRQIEDFVRKASVLLRSLDKSDPTRKWDGYKNIWILKPARQSRGIGIMLKNSLDDILQFSSDNLYKKYIAQKYIERPFLIYNTKFDIRQYVLLTIDYEKLYIWLYKDCYLKFSSTNFNLDDLNEQVHLTNNSVQKKYRNKLNRDHRLPHCNMWSGVQFEKYLNDNGYPEKTLEKKIYSGFKENIIALTLAGIEDIELIPNSFDLYGVDFMLDETLQPILIEVNSQPDMSASTAVTSSLCPKVLKDMIKVVLDLPKNRQASTGLFEMVFETKYRAGLLASDKSDMTVVGKALTIRPPLLKKQQKAPKKNYPKIFGYRP